MNYIKKWISVFTALVIVLMSCSAKDKRFATIKGYFNGNAAGKEIQLSKVEHGAKVKVGTTKVAANGNFAFTCSVDEPGIFVVNVISTKTQRNVNKDHDLKRFYLENGVEIDINLREGDYELLKTNSRKNKLLSQWNSQIDTTHTYSHGFFYFPATYDDYFPLLPGFVEEMKAFKSKINSGDPKFDELLKLMVETDMAGSALRMVQSPRTKHPKREQFPVYYDTILAEQAPQSMRLLELPGGRFYITCFVDLFMKNKPKSNSKEEYLTTCMSSIKNDTLKAYFILSNLRYYKSYDDNYIAFRKKVEPYFINTYQKEKLKEYELSIRTFEKGTPAFDFSGKDVEGKEYKLSDFKGNVVYVDVWATWCGPCKVEIPPLKELEKKFHGETITFLSISLDEHKNHQKWVDFVKEKELKGVQLIADKAFDSDVAKTYDIKGIPRFMIFDKEGKIVTTDAPRPSNESIENMLRNLIKVQN